MQCHERSFGGFHLRPTAPTRLDKSSLRAKHALVAKIARRTELPTDFRLPYSSTRSHQSPLGRAQTYIIDSTDDKHKDQNNTVEKTSNRKGHFRLTESDSVRDGLIVCIWCRKDFGNILASESRLFAHAAYNTTTKVFNLDGKTSVSLHWMNDGWCLCTRIRIVENLVGCITQLVHLNRSGKLTGRMCAHQIAVRTFVLANV